MYTSKKTREYPSEFTVSDPGSQSWVTFHGSDAKERSGAYAEWLNSAPAAPEGHE